MSWGSILRCSLESIVSRNPCTVHSLRWIQPEVILWGLLALQLSLLCVLAVHLLSGGHSAICDSCHQCLYRLRIAAASGVSTAVRWASLLLCLVSRIRCLLSLLCKSHSSTPLHGCQPSILISLGTSWLFYVIAWVCLVWGFLLHA